MPGGAMPTGAKLVAALCLATLAYVLSENIKPLFPEGTNFGIFSWVNVAIGIACGWRIIGGGAGRGMAIALSNGMTGAVALVFWGLFVQAVNEMTGRAMANRYGGPLEALTDIFAIGAEFGGMLLVPSVLGTMAAGGLLAGGLAELASRIWR